MKQLTIRGMSRDVERKIRQVAKKEDISLNKAALRLLQSATAPVLPEKEGTIGHSLDRFFGTMSNEEADQIDESVKYWDSVDLSFQK